MHVSHFKFYRIVCVCGEGERERGERESWCV